MKGSELVIKALRDKGVQYVFGYTGGAIMPVFDEMEKQKTFAATADVIHVEIDPSAGDSIFKFSTAATTNFSSFRSPARPNI